jgi:hypothetical protein
MKGLQIATAVHNTQAHQTSQSHTPQITDSPPMATADKEQLITIPMVDADEAHTLVSSGYGYLDVR